MSFLSRTAMDAATGWWLKQATSLPTESKARLRTALEHRLMQVMDTRDKTVSLRLIDGKPQGLLDMVLKDVSPNENARKLLLAHFPKHLSMFVEPDRVRAADGHSFVYEILYEGSTP